ncbi:MAG TPA: hypothetical protein VGM41_15385 [Chitinophagaceae bacterium]|jgi:uncharacterized protein YPO0396
MPVFKDLNEQERAQLLKFPAYVSLLAASADSGLDKQEKNAVIKLTHIKTFSCDPVLTDFYSEVDKHFETTIAELNNQFPHNRQERDTAIKKELNKLEVILRKLDKTYATIMHNSLKNYKDHVSKAHRNVLEYFIFPMPIGGITD